MATLTDIIQRLYYLNGDSVHLPSLPVADAGYIIGSYIFRSPEATLAPNRVTLQTFGRSGNRRVHSSLDKLVYAKRCLVN